MTKNIKSINKCIDKNIDRCKKSVYKAIYNITDKYNETDDGNYYLIQGLLNIIDGLEGLKKLKEE